MGKEAPQVSKEEVRRNFQWKKIRFLALGLSEPGVRQPDGSDVKPNLDKLITKMREESYDAYSNVSASRYNARELMRRYIESLKSTKNPPDEETERHRSLFAEIKALNPKVKRPDDLYEVFGVPREIRRKNSDPNDPFNPSAVIPYTEALIQVSPNTEIYTEPPTDLIDHIRSVPRARFIGAKTSKVPELRIANKLQD